MPSHACQTTCYLHAGLPLLQKPFVERDCGWEVTLRSSASSAAFLCQSANALPTSCSLWKLWAMFIAALHVDFRATKSIQLSNAADSKMDLRRPIAFVRTSLRAALCGAKSDQLLRKENKGGH